MNADEYLNYPLINIQQEEFFTAPEWVGLGTYLISDTHFYHAKIAEYCQRPDGWQEQIIQNWNRMIGAIDNVFHLGDFSFGRTEQVQSVLAQLSGKKRLLLGNHDNRRSAGAWGRLGFEQVFREKYLCFQVGAVKVIFSHYPCLFDLQEGVLNIHGHIHNTPCELVNDPYHFNICVEVNDYQPVTLGEIIRRCFGGQ